MVAKKKPSKISKLNLDIDVIENSQLDKGATERGHWNNDESKNAMAALHSLQNLEKAPEMLNGMKPGRGSKSIAGNMVNKHYLKPNMLG